MYTSEDADWITKTGIKKQSFLAGKTKMSSQNELTLEEHIVLIKMIPMRSFLGPVPPLVKYKFPKYSMQKHTCPIINNEAFGICFPMWEMQPPLNLSC